MIDGIEERLQVGVHHPPVAVLHRPVHHRQGGGAALLGPKPVAASTELRLEERFQDVAQRLLHDPIPDRGNAQRALAALRSRPRELVA